MLLRIEEDKAERAKMGFPDLTYTIKDGQRTVSVDVAGTMLTDYPEITRDWDHEKNERPRRGSATAAATSGGPRSASGRRGRPGVSPAQRLARP